MIWIRRPVVPCAARVHVPALAAATEIDQIRCWVRTSFPIIRRRCSIVAHRLRSRQRLLSQLRSRILVVTTPGPAVSGKEYA